MLVTQQELYEALIICREKSERLQKQITRNENKLAQLTKEFKCLAQN